MARVLIPFRHPHKVTPYAEAVRAEGAETATVLVTEQPAIGEFDGLLLMGGTDVNAARYGQESHSQNDAPDDERDEVEWRLIDEALEKDIPILAICRGLQILNVHHGGTLRQHLEMPRHDVESEDKGAAAHEVILEPESHLAQVFGEIRLRVNSRHHQAVDRIGEGLRVAARDEEDGAIVEGLEQPNRRFVLGVQWHPEDQVKRHTEQRRLFRRFVEACGR
jgi:putative glutamine amidotransferase